MKRLAIAFGAMILLTAFGDDVYFNVKEGNRLYKEEKYSEAMEQYRKAQNGDPESGTVDYNLGGTLYKLGRYDEAVKAYGQAMTSKEEPMKGKAGYNRGTALLKGGEQAEKEMKMDVAERMLTESVKQLKEVALNYPANPSALHNLELAIEKLKKLEKQKQQDKKGEDKKEGDKSQSQQKEEDQKQTEDEKKQSKADKGEKDEDQKSDETKKNNAGDQDRDMTPEKARQIMDAVERDEQALREKMHAAKPEDNHQHEKDW